LRHRALPLEPLSHRSYNVPMDGPGDGQWVLGMGEATCGSSAGFLSCPWHHGPRLKDTFSEGI
jgi:hypothetical protein